MRLEVTELEDSEMNTEDLKVFRVEEKVLLASSELPPLPVSRVAVV